MWWWPGRGHGAVQGLAREHTARAGAREAPAPRLAYQALPDPTAPTRRQHRWTAGNKTTSSMACRASAGHAGQPRPPSRRRQNPVPPGRGCGVGQGGVREARRKSRRLRGASPRVRVPSSERRHGRGLAAPRPRLRQVAGNDKSCSSSAKHASAARLATITLERPLSNNPAKTATSRTPSSGADELCVGSRRALACPPDT